MECKNTALEFKLFCADRNNHLTYLHMCGSVSLSVCLCLSVWITASESCIHCFYTNELLIMHEFRCNSGVKSPVNFSLILNSDTCDHVLIL